MAIQIAGIAWLWGAIVLLFGRVVSWVAEYATKKTLLASAYVAAILTLAFAFHAAITAILSTISIAPPPEFTQASAMFLPSNTGLCVSSIISAHILRWSYDMKMRATAAYKGFAI